MPVIEGRSGEPPTHLRRPWARWAQRACDSPATPILPQGQTLLGWEGSTIGRRPHSTAMGQQQLPVGVPVSQAKHPVPDSGTRGALVRLPCAGRAPSTRRHCIGGSSVPHSAALPRPVAAVVKDSLLEERRELTNGVFGKGQPHLVDVQGGCGGLEHHAEKVPEVFLRKRQEPTHG